MNKKILVILFMSLTISSLFGKAFKGAECRTIDSYLYGRYESRYKPFVGTGMLANFFTYNDFSTTSADWNEIDIEILGRYENDIQFTTITPYQTIYDSHTYLDFNPAQDYHIYAFEWTPDYVAWFIDGQEYYRQTADHIASLNHAQKIMVNIWAPDEGSQVGSWTGKWDPQILPLFAYYDWLSYASYTPGAGTIGTNNNFTSQWKDDFNSFDTTRWQKSHNHTWPGNRVDMDQSNVIFKDGELILALTDEQNTGYVDKNPPIILWARADKTELKIRYSEQVDSTAAVTISKYNVTDLELFGIELLDDQRTVVLQTSEFDTSNSYSLVIFGMTDNSPNKNVKTYDVKSINVTKPPSFPLRINIGGEALYSGKYLSDQVWLPELEYGHMDGWKETIDGLINIAGTEEDSLYQTGLRKVVKYKVRVPDGTYDVTLHFAENTFETAGARVFDVHVEKPKIVESLDIFAATGKNTAYDIKAENVLVEDGIIDIHFSKWVSHPFLCGLTIEQKSTDIDNGNQGTPQGFKLFQNYPNPFNPETTIKYNLSKESKVNLTIFDSLGRTVKTLVDGSRPAGIYEIQTQLNVSSGIYFYKLSSSSFSGNYSAIKKMLLLK